MTQVSDPGPSWPSCLENLVAAAEYWHWLVVFLLLAHLSTTCSRELLESPGVCRTSFVVVVHLLSSTISLNIFSFQTAVPIWTKLGRNVPWEVLFKACSQNLIPSKTLVAMVMK